MNLLDLSAVQSFDKLVELLAIRLGCHKTPTKSLVMSKGELMQRADLKK